MSLAEQIYTEAMTLPDEAAAEVLDFLRFLKTRYAPTVVEPSRAIDFSVFDAVPNRYEGPLDRESLYDRAGLR